MVESNFRKNGPIISKAPKDLSSIDNNPVNYKLKN